MPQSRRQFLLLDLVAIVVLAGFGLAFVRSVRPGGGAALIGLPIVIGIVFVVWLTYRGKVTGPVCAECGLKFVPVPQPMVSAACPRCGQNQSRRRKLRQLAGALTLALSVILIVAGMSNSNWINAALYTARWVHWRALFLALPIVRVVILLSLVRLGAFGFELFRRAPDPRKSPCERCGHMIEPPEPDARPVCHRCRLRLLPGQEREQEILKTRRNLLLSLVFLSCIIGLGISWQFADHDAGISVGATIGFSAAVFGVLMTVVFIAFFVYRLAQRRKRGSERYLLGLARRAAAEDGELVRSGSLTVWYTGDFDPVPLLREQIDVTRGRLETLLGRSCSPLPGARVVYFDKRAAFEAFLKSLGLRDLAGVSLQEGVCLRTPRSVLAFCSETAPYRMAIPELTVQSAAAVWLWQTAPGKRHEPWITTGVSQLLWLDERMRPRLDRKMLASLGRGTALGTELFAIATPDLVELVQNWNDFTHFCKLQQFITEAGWVLEYLGGAAAPDERRARLRAFLNDAQPRKEPEELFRSHFGFGYAELVTRWRECVQEQGDGTFALPDRRVQHALIERLIPLIENRQADARERILAVRAVGITSQALAAGALIKLLKHGNDRVPKEEVVWALEAIAGIHYGDDVERWARWWESLPADITQPRRSSARDPSASGSAAKEPAGAAAGSLLA